VGEEIIKNIALNAVVLSFMYILAALGFAFVLNMMGTVNIAHGAIFMVSAFICYYMTVWLGVNSWVAFFITIIIMALFGVLMERIMFRPFFDNITRIIMMGIALITLMQTTVTVTTGTKHLIIPPFTSGGTTAIFGTTISNERIMILAMGAGLLVVVLLVVNNTTLGRQMEAISQDRTAASLQGININKVSATVCAIGFALAAVSGCMMGELQRISPTMGDNILLRILMICMIAGAGSMNGLIVTGCIIGVMDAILPVYLQGSTVSALSAGVAMVLLLIKPKGFFGHEM